MEHPKKLYRSRYDTVIGGVAGGLAEYFNIDVVIIRIIFVLLALAAAGGILIYIILWIVVPLNPDYSFHSNHQFKSSENMEENKENKSTEQKDYPKPPFPDYEHKKQDGNLIAGIILITLGVMFLIDRFIPSIDFGDLWPLLLIVAGILIMKNHSDKRKTNY